MSKKKNVIARVGNFEITKESGAEHDYIRIKTVSGSWGITHRDDSPMYGAWMMMCKNPEYKRGLEVRCTMEYIMSQILYDERFISDWWGAYNSYCSRGVAASPVPTEKEEAEALETIEILEKAKEILTGEDESI